MKIHSGSEVRNTALAAKIAEFSSPYPSPGPMSAMKARVTTIPASAPMAGADLVACV
ncbi:hypothetical protein HDA32_003578 [Spinactinospora alkalitolerans]|uniref:Uncharacterized protein n=1 Tax=Spinactinospora alkalitolerans TaxID=687207 RepID=A0A852TWZ0_9ACTN|nr:hypothetical protein [Spinactinospora alkalitolerans]NYE48458.1 hypothetical protein [Spinactinospora alkalitolerans]